MVLISSKTKNWTPSIKARDSTTDQTYVLLQPLPPASLNTSFATIDPLTGALNIKYTWPTDKFALAVGSISALVSNTCFPSGIPLWQHLHIPGCCKPQVLQRDGHWVRPSSCPCIRRHLVRWNCKPRLLRCLAPTQVLILYVTLGATLMCNKKDLLKVESQSQCPRVALLQSCAEHDRTLGSLQHASSVPGICLSTLEARRVTEIADACSSLPTNSSLTSRLYIIALIFSLRTTKCTQC